MVTCCVSEDLIASLRCPYNETIHRRSGNLFEITASCGWRQKGMGGMRAEGVHEGDNKKGLRTHFTVQVGPKFTALVLQPPGWPQPGLVHWGLTTVTQSRRGLTRGSESLAQLNEGLRARCTWNPRPDPLCDASIPHPFPLRATWRWEDLVLPSSRILNPRLHRPLPFPQRVWGS